MKPKYLIIGGSVRSKNDLELHYVNPMELVSLYGVDKKECILFNGDDDYKLRAYRKEDFIVLMPREDGNYILEDGVEDYPTWEGD